MSCRLFQYESKRRVSTVRECLATMGQCKRGSTCEAGDPRAPIVTDDVWITGAQELWKAGYTGKGCRVAVVDTGINHEHPDLKVNVAVRRDFVRDGCAPQRYNEHGTHVAGVIAANGEMKGVAPDAVLYDYRVLDTEGRGSADAMARAIRCAVDEDEVHVINVSAGTPQDHRSLLKASDYAQKKGVLVIAAAGNEGKGTKSYPAYYTSAVSVGAVEYDPFKGKVYIPRTPWFSSSNQRVNVCADGWDVVSTHPSKGYVSLSGTSMACPHVAGYAALLWQKCGGNANILRKEVLSRVAPCLTPKDKDITGKGFSTHYTSIVTRYG